MTDSHENLFHKESMCGSSSFRSNYNHLYGNSGALKTNKETNRKNRVVTFSASISCTFLARSNWYSSFGWIIVRVWLTESSFISVQGQVIITHLCKQQHPNERWQQEVQAFTFFDNVWQYARTRLVLSTGIQGIQTSPLRPPISLPAQPSEHVFCHVTDILEALALKLIESWFSWDSQSWPLVKGWG